MVKNIKSQFTSEIERAWPRDIKGDEKRGRFLVFFPYPFPQSLGILTAEASSVLWVNWTVMGYQSVGWYPGMIHAGSRASGHVFYTQEILWTRLALTEYTQSTRGRSSPLFSHTCPANRAAESDGENLLVINNNEKTLGQQYGQTAWCGKANGVENSIALEYWNVSHILKAKAETCRCPFLPFFNP